MSKVDWKNRELISELVSKATCISDVLHDLGITCTQSNYATFNKWVRIHSLSLGHFTAGIKRKNALANASANKTKWTIDNAFTENSLCNRSIVRKLILQYNLIEYKCSSCGNTGVWCNAPLTLQLEHKNGISNDHRLVNLTFLCANCHSQTSTYAGRNASGNKKVRQATKNRNDQTNERRKLKSADLKYKLNTIPDHEFIGWGSKQRIAALLGIKPGKLMNYIAQYAPEFIDRFQ